MVKRCDQRAGPKVPANDNGRTAGKPLDPRIRRVAEAIGRHLAREHIRHPPPVNDNEPRSE